VKGWPSSVALRLFGVGLSTLVATAPATAEGPGALTAGTIAVGIAGGVSASFNDPPDDSKTVYGYHGLLRLDAVVTDERGPGVFRGNLEVGLQPMYIHLDARPSSADLVGGAFVTRWLLTGNDTLRPYIEVGGGVIGGRAGLRTGNCDVNFVLEGGPGVLLFVGKHTAIDLGYRYHHISNGGRCGNDGYNSNMGVVGLSYFFN
jgi:lipid A 3-O-deacylase